MTFADRVRAALPDAQETLIAGGIMADPQPNRKTWWQKVEQSTGRSIDTEKIGDAGFDDLEAALALGIALGLLLRPETFGIGGAGPLCLPKLRTSEDESIQGSLERTLR